MSFGTQPSGNSTSGFRFVLLGFSSRGTKRGSTDGLWWFNDDSGDTGVRGWVTRASGGRDAGVRGDVVSGVTQASGVRTYSLHPDRPVPMLTDSFPSPCIFRIMR